MSLKRWLCSVICSTALASNSWADQVNLSNGDRVTGKLIKKDGDNLTVKTDLMGEVTIPWKSVVSCEFPGSGDCCPDEWTVACGPVSVDAKEEKVEVATATTTESARLNELVAIRNAETQRQFERMEKPGLLDLWAGTVDLGLSAARGNAQNQHIHDCSWCQSRDSD